MSPVTFLTASHAAIKRSGVPVHPSSRHKIVYTILNVVTVNEKTEM
jgi:hypothetical protein